MTIVYIASPPSLIDRNAFWDSYLKFQGEHESSNLERAIVTVGRSFVLLFAFFAFSEMVHHCEVYGCDNHHLYPEK